MTDDLIRRLMFPDSEEEWEEAHAENEAAPREPGKFKIIVGKPRPIEPGQAVCEDCGRTIRWGGGIRYFDELSCPDHPGRDDCLVIHEHWSEDCPAWRNRLWRLWHRYTWGRVERRWRSWKWRRVAKRERADPRSWVEFWKRGGK